MAKITSLNELKKRLQKKVDNALNKEVAQAIKETEQEVIEEVVYDAYEPVFYQRRGSHGWGLGDMRNMHHKVISGWYSADSSWLEVSNLTAQNDKYAHGSWGSPYIDSFVEHGTNYDYWGNPFPRPFIKKTIERLAQSDILKEALKKGLKRNGVNAN